MAYGYATSNAQIQNNASTQIVSHQQTSGAARAPD
jgi:hypothetical protein